MSASKRSLMRGTTWMRVDRANISATLSAGAPLLRHYSHLAGGATTIPIAWEGAWEGLRGAYHGTILRWPSYSGRSVGLLQSACGKRVGRMILIEPGGHLPMQGSCFYACFYAFLVITDQRRGVGLEVLSLPAIEIALVFILLQQLFLLR